jgi:hypothetical protein
MKEYPITFDEFTSKFTIEEHRWKTTFIDRDGLMGW